MKLADPGRYTQLAPAPAGSNTRLVQIARLQSRVEAARRELAGSSPGQLRLFRPPLRDCSREIAQRWLDEILLPVDDRGLFFRVRVWSRSVHADPSGHVGIWHGFQRGWLSPVELIIGDDDGRHGSSLHMAPGNVIDLEVIEPFYDRAEDDEW
jgi:hypothetical protein